MTVLTRSFIVSIESAIPVHCGLRILTGVSFESVFEIKDEFILESAYTKNNLEIQ